MAAGECRNGKEHGAIATKKKEEKDSDVGIEVA
jgi:hypothetical protein